LFIAKNYEGDVANFDMALKRPAERCRPSLLTTTSRVNPTYTTGRRGVAGTMITRRSGRGAEEGRDLDSPKAPRRQGQCTNASMGGLTSCIILASPQADFETREQVKRKQRGYPRRALPSQ
jgi:dihydroxyacetone kinase